MASELKTRMENETANNGVQRTRHKVSGPLTPDVLLRNTMKNEWRYRDDNR